LDYIGLKQSVAKSHQELFESLRLVQTEKKRRVEGRRVFTFYPETGPLRRDLYKPHIDFFAAGAKARERCIIAANGIGKTEGIGGYETVLHLTGLYPKWWNGRRFNHPIRSWCAGDTGQTTKDIIQDKLLGPPGEEGTGLIPEDYLIKDKIRKKAGGVPDAIESIQVKHTSGGNSHLMFKSYDQGRRAFQGTERHWIWLDEECPPTVYDECLMRTRKVNGTVALTFTPIEGLTTTVLNFMPNGLLPAGGWLTKSKFVNSASWEDAPHLTEDEKEQILAGTLPHLRDARSKGIPNIGSGVIYPIDHETITVDPFTIPIWFHQVFGLDMGWNFTAALWGALDPDHDILYITDAYKRGQAEPPIHAAAINARGEWIPGVTDPAKGTSQRDGKRLLKEYGELLRGQIWPADNAVDAGLLSAWKRMTTGRLKIFRGVCAPLFDELRLYRRNDKGDIVKENDHLCDDLRYICISGVKRAIPVPDEDAYNEEQARLMGRRYAGKGRNRWSGY